MHVLSSQYRSEFLATPQLVRFDFPHGAKGREPTLLIKATNLLLKYIIRGVPFGLVFAPLSNGGLLYGLRVFDDPEKPAVIWSVLEAEDEKTALLEICKGSSCQIFLFNELAIPVAWAELAKPDFSTSLQQLVTGSFVGKINYQEILSQARHILSRIHLGYHMEVNAIVIDMQNTVGWKAGRNTFITAAAAASELDLTDDNEGRQQEEMAVWLTDNLHPKGAYLNPQVADGKKTRELTDILLTYEYGSFLIESKVLSILGRNNLPSRTKLTKDVSSHISKAVRQLQGSVRKINSRARIFDRNGNDIHVSSDKTNHAIVLIPELDLIAAAKEYDIHFMRSFMEATKGYLHILDIAELLRVVQAAEMIAEKEKEATVIMAFDHYLIERAKKAVEIGRLNFEMLISFG
jgi:hypothetical protein